MSVNAGFIKFYLKSFIKNDINSILERCYVRGQL